MKLNESTGSHSSPSLGQVARGGKPRSAPTCVCMHFSLAWIETAGLLLPGQCAVHQNPNSFMSRSTRLPLAVTPPSSLTADLMRTWRLVG